MTNQVQESQIEDAKWFNLGVSILVPSLLKEYNVYTYEIKAGHRQKQISFSDNNFTLLYRQINDHTPI